jgi:D-alanyl-D-alanine carboxypeptidase
LWFPPGTRWEYSNTNFVLLGMVIEKATGMSYADVPQKRLFEPLELDMRVAQSGDDSPELVRCYTGSPRVDTSTPQDPSYGWSAGSIVSKPADLARWLVALYGGDVVSNASRQAMTTPNGLPTPGAGGLRTRHRHRERRWQRSHARRAHRWPRRLHDARVYLEQKHVAIALMSNLTDTDLRAASAHGWAAVLGIPYP